MKRAHRGVERTLIRVVVAIAVGLAGAGVSAADTLEGPTSVVAAADGSFSYTTVFTAGDDGTLLAFWEAYDGGNTDYVAWVADAECMFPLDPGEQIVEPIDGSLIDTTLPGSVTIRYVDCSGGELILETTVFPATAAVPVSSPWALTLMGALFVAAGAVLFRRWAVSSPAIEFAWKRQFTV